MNLALFYHCILSGGSVLINTEFACSILMEQMTALARSGLLEAATEFHVGINGSEEDLELARLFVPAKARFIMHGAGSTTEIPTLQHLQRWLPSHEDWKVLYHHQKGVTHPREPAYAVWRRRMERACVWNWRLCLDALANGSDACGCHWLTPQGFPKLVRSPFFGGTFWWANASYLKTLPGLPIATWENRFEAEMWIGRSKPRVKDYLPGWP